jgi:glutamyl-tRNA synthetase
LFPIKKELILYLNFGNCDFFFVAPSEYDAKATKNWKAETPALMQELIVVVDEITDFTR